MASKLEFEFTDPQKIIDSVNETLNAFASARTKLNQSSIRYTDNYDEINNADLLDATILRERMKLAVIKSTTNDKL